MTLASSIPCSVAGEAEALPGWKIAAKENEERSCADSEAFVHRTSKPAACSEARVTVSAEEAPPDASRTMTSKPF